MNVDLVIVMGSSLAVGPVNQIPQWVPDECPQILINREPVGRSIAEWDVELLGDCDSICTELSRRLGWKIPKPGMSEKLSVTEPEPFEFVEPNRYLFRNAKVEYANMSSDDEGPEGDESEGQPEGHGQIGGAETGVHGGTLIEEEPGTFRPAASTVQEPTNNAEAGDMPAEPLLQ